MWYGNGNGIVWNGSLFVAIGSGTNTIANSPDGVNWTGIGTSIFTTQGNRVCWGNSLFIAGGSGTNTLAYSTDGSTWIGLGTSIFSTSCNEICWNGSIFIAVGTGTNTIASSLDGITWTGRGSSIFTTSGYGVCWNGNLFIACHGVTWNWALLLSKRSRRDGKRICDLRVFWLCCCDWVIRKNMGGTAGSFAARLYIDFAAVFYRLFTI